MTSKTTLKSFFPTIFKQIFTLALTFSLAVSSSLLVVAENENSPNDNFRHKSEKTQVLVSQISYNKPSALSTVWPTVGQLFTENEETTLQFNGRLEMEKISLPMSVEVKKTDTLETIGRKWQENVTQVLSSLSEIKKSEGEFWTQKAGEITSENISSLQQHATLLANLDSLELEKLAQPENQKEISVESFTISRSNLNTQTNQNLAKIAQEKGLQEKTVDLTQEAQSSSVNSVTSLEPNVEENLQMRPTEEADLKARPETNTEEKDTKLQPKMKLRSEKAQIAQKTPLLEEKLQEKQNQQVQSSSSNSADLNSSNSNFKSTLGSFSSSSSSSSLASLPAEAGLTIKDILEVKEESNFRPKERKIGKDMIQEGKIIWFKSQEESLPGTEKAEQPDTVEETEKVVQIETFVYENLFYMSLEEENAKNAQIETEKQKALEHNKKVKQFYSLRHYQEMVKNKLDPDPNIYSFAVINEQNRELTAEEILKIKEEIENPKPGTEILETVLNFGSLKAQARGLNNAAIPLLLYNGEDNNLAIDLPHADLTNGNQLAAHERHGNLNQLFWFDNATNRIVSSEQPSKCLDISGGNYSGATAVQIWDCHSDHNQQWFFNGMELKPLHSPNFCLDAAGGLSAGARLILWECHGGTNQKWIAGVNNFESNFEVSIHAKPVGYMSFNGDYGHALISHKVNASLVNTQTSWPGYDTDCGQTQTINDVETLTENNICDNDAAYINKKEDWEYALNPEGNGFRTKTELISKKTSDLYRYNSGYRWQPQNYTWCNVLNNINYTIIYLNDCSGNCATFSTRVWNNIMEETQKDKLYPVSNSIPSHIYDVL